MLKRRALLKHTLAGTAGLAAGTVPAPFICPARAAADPLHFTLNWFAQAEYGGFYQALADGLYDQAGLNVTIEQGGPQINDVQLLLAGRTDIILGGCEQALLAAQNGLPVTAIGTTTQKFLAGLITHTDIHDPRDLRGHPILIGTESRTTFWPWLRQTYGFSDSQAGVDTSNLQPFALNPRAAMQTLVSAEPYAAQQQRIPFNYLLLADLGYPAYGNMVLTSRTMLKTRRDALGRFMRATGEGWRRYIWGDGTRGDAAILKANHSMTQGQIDYSRQTLRRVLAFGQSGEAIGSMSDARWQKIHDVLVTSGAMPDFANWKDAYSLDLLSSLDAKVP